MPTWLERLVQDVRHGARLLAKSPAFTAIAVLSIAFGTGANVAIFSVADALLLRPLQVPRPGELLIIGSPVTRDIQKVTASSYLDYLDIRSEADTFEGVFAQLLRRASVAPQAGAPAQVRLVNLVSANFFDVLQIRPVIGRGFTAGEERVSGRDAVAVLSYGSWQQRYGGDPAVVGRTVRINAVDFTIVGVAPQGFDGIEEVGIPESVFIPLAMAPALGDAGLRQLLTARDLRMLTVRGRLKDGVHIDTARVQLAAIGQNLARAYPATNREQALVARTELEERFISDYLDVGLVLLLTILSSGVLAVACANVAGLLASRAPTRVREMSLRLALGAGRGRLVRQLVTESVMLACAGGLGGLAVGYAGILLLQGLEFPSDLVSPPPFRMDQRALIFSLAVAMASAFFFGLGPALQTTRVDLAGAMRATDAGTPRRWRLSGRSALVATQVALSLVLVTVAVFSLQVFRRVDLDGPGFRRTQIGKISVDTAHRHYDERQAQEFFERVLQGVRDVPDVTSATVTSAMPFWTLDMVSIVAEGSAVGDDRAAPRTVAGSVDEQYFETMDIPIRAGRGFRNTDSAETTAVAVVNETLARHHWPWRDPVGRRFRVGAGTGPWVEVVGVATDSKYLYIVEPPQEAVYFPFRQRPRPSMIVLARTSAQSTAAVAALREVIAGVDAEMPTYEAQTIETFYAARGTALLGVATELIGAIGMMGTILTMVGLYGLASYSVSRRTREIGIRMAIGAGYGRVLRMILYQGMRPAWVGLPAGFLLSVVTVRVLPTIFPTGERTSVATFAIIVPALLIVALLATLVPARRAALLDPTIALRHD